MTGPVLPTYALDGDVAVITLDDGKANVMSTAVIDQLNRHLDQAETDGARALLLVGRPGRFSAGFDLDEMTAGTDSMRALVAHGARWMLRLYTFPMPTVVACTGHALAAGALTVLSSDVRIGADIPAKIGLNEVAIGMALPKFAVELARARLAPAAFVPATVLAQIFDPTKAVAAGYLDRVVPADELFDTARAEAARLAVLHPDAVGATKLNLRAAMVDQQLALLDEDLSTLEVPSV